MEQDASGTLGDFLLPRGFRRPGITEVLREGSVVAEVGRYALATWAEHRHTRDATYAALSAARAGHPVLLVPGFLAGDCSLVAMARTLRRRGYRTYRSHITANVGCTINAAALLEARLESIAIRRDAPVSIVGHSLGGMLARGLAVRRPDLIAGIVTMGSPMLAPGAHHVALTAGVEGLVRLSRAGLSGHDGRGVRGRQLRPPELRGEPAAHPARGRLHRDLLQARRDRGLARLHRPGGACGRGDRVTHRHGPGSAGH